MNIGGIFKSLLNPVNLAMLATPAGWAKLALSVLGPQVGMAIIQKLGEKLGLPQSVISAAQSAFAAAIGRPDMVAQNLTQAAGSFAADMANQFNLPPAAEGRLARQLNSDMNRTVDRVVAEQLEGIRPGGRKGEDDEETGGSVLMRIARNLGKLLDDKMDVMAEKAEQLGALGGNSADGKTDGAAAQWARDNGYMTTATKEMRQAGSAPGDVMTDKGKSQMGRLSAELQALGQEISYLSNALSSTIKSIGESNTTLARK